MRKILALAVLFTAALAGFGCQHVAGRCDCSHHAEDAQLPGNANPYPVVGSEKAAK